MAYVDYQYVQIHTKHAHLVAYCFSNKRKVMCEKYNDINDKQMKIGNILQLERKLENVYVKNKIIETNLLDKLLQDKITWHCGGMSDPFQPIEKTFNVTRDVVELTKKYDVSILFSTKTDNIYHCNLDPKLHTLQLSVSNVFDRKDIESNVTLIQNRINFFKQLKKDGFRVGIRIQPFIPGITTVDIIEIFKDADFFTIECIKIVTSDHESKKMFYDLYGSHNFKLNNGLLQTTPQFRLQYYQAFFEKLREYKIPFSVADNDLRYISDCKCCCGDMLVSKSTDFNTTAMIRKYGLEYTLSDVEHEATVYKNCYVDMLCMSNQKIKSGKREMIAYIEDKFDKNTSTISPNYQYKT
jgi:DNA repair photolyase